MNILGSPTQAVILVFRWSFGGDVDEKFNEKKDRLKMKIRKSKNLLNFKV